MSKIPENESRKDFLERENSDLRDAIMDLNKQIVKLQLAKSWPVSLDEMLQDIATLMHGEKKLEENLPDTVKRVLEERNSLKAQNHKLIEIVNQYESNWVDDNI